MFACSVFCGTRSERPLHPARPMIVYRYCWPPVAFSVGRPIGSRFVGAISCVLSDFPRFIFGLLSSIVVCRSPFLIHSSRKRTRLAWQPGVRYVYYQLKEPCGTLAVAREAVKEAGRKIDEKKKVPIKETQYRRTR